MNEKTELIGILGLGFLGKELAALTSVSYTHLTLPTKA